MTHVQRWIYKTLLQEAFVCSTRPRLPADDAVLWLLADCESEEQWLENKAVILKMFKKDGDLLIHPRLEEDWQRLLDKREEKIEAGRRGAEKRWGKLKDKKGNAIGDHSLPIATDAKRREVREEKVSEVSEEQEPDMKLKDELTKISAAHGAKAGGYKTTWDEIKSLGVAHGTGAVATDFTSFMEEYHGDDFPAGAVVSYLRVAADRLTASTAPAAVVSKDPRVVGLIRELTYLSGDKVTFQGRHKVALADLLGEYTSEELIGVFQTFIQDKDLEDSYTLKFITQNFLDAADGLAYSARKRKQEAEAGQIAREAAVRRLQDEAETQRLLREAQKDKENDVFDPLASE
jgi:uncharacterized protein YdaU (DUF1376 family)